MNAGTNDVTPDRVRYSLGRKKLERTWKDSQNNPVLSRVSVGVAGETRWPLFSAQKVRDGNIFDRNWAPTWIYETKP